MGENYVPDAESKVVTNGAKRISSTLAKRFSLWAFAIALGFLVAVWVLARDQQPLVCPISLTEGFSVTRPFRVTEAARYSIELRCRRVISSEALIRQLGEDDLVKVEIRNDNVPIVMRRTKVPAPTEKSTLPPEYSRLGFSEKMISEEIGTFKGDPKARYTITCTSLRTTNELIQTDPTVIVTLDWGQVEVQAILSGILWVGAIACTLVSIIFFWLAQSRRGTKKIGAK